MKVAPHPINEQERLKSLKQYFIPYVSQEEDFADITDLACMVCETPVCYISFAGIDATLLKSQYGISPRIIPDFSFNSDQPGTEVFTIPDLTTDSRYSHNVLVTGTPYLVFYASAPIIDSEGSQIGRLCVAGNRPHSLTRSQKDALLTLARQTFKLLELRREKIQYDHKKTEIAGILSDQEQLTRIASHDLKSPLNNIISLTHLIKDGYGKKLDEEGNEYITFLNEAAYQLSDLISSIVLYSKSAQIPVDKKDTIAVHDLIIEVINLLNVPAHVTIKYKNDDSCIVAPRQAIKQVLLQLLLNAIQYNNSSRITAEVLFHENESDYTFEVKDNGPGIADEDKEKVFNLFERLQKNKDGESMGIGLAIAKRLVQKMGGTIKVESPSGSGCSFIFAIPR